MEKIIFGKTIQFYFNKKNVFRILENYTILVRKTEVLCWINLINDLSKFSWLFLLSLITNSSILYILYYTYNDVFFFIPLTTQYGYI